MAEEVTTVAPEVEESSRKPEDDEQERADEEQKKANAAEEAVLKTAEDGNKIIAEEREAAKKAHEADKKLAAEEAAFNKAEEAAEKEAPKKAANEEDIRKEAEDAAEKKAAEAARKMAEEVTTVAPEVEESSRKPEDDEQERADEEQKKANAAEEAVLKTAEDGNKIIAEEGEAAKKAHEADKELAAEEAASNKAEEAAKKEAVDEEATRWPKEAPKEAADEEDTRKEVEDAAKKKAADEEEARRDTEEAAKKIADEEHARKIAEEAARKRAAEQEENRKKADEDANMSNALEEASKNAVEEEKKRIAEEEDQQKLLKEQEEAAIKIQSHQRGKAMRTRVEKKKNAAPIPMRDFHGATIWEVSLVKSESARKFGFSHSDGKAEFLNARSHKAAGEGNKVANAKIATDPNTPGPEELIVRKVGEKCMMEEWNFIHPDAQVRLYDRITQVNGYRSVQEMKKELRRCTSSVTLEILRYPPRITVDLKKRDGARKLGFKFEKPSNQNLPELRITEVVKEGLLEEENQRRIAQGLYHLVVTAGMRIEIANEAHGCGAKIAEELKTCDAVRMQIKRMEVAQGAKNKVVMKVKTLAGLTSGSLSNSHGPGELLHHVRKT